jgi:hypothetical protein
MTIYFFTILLLFVFSLLVEYYEFSLGIKIWMILISYILLVFQVGLRWETGTDWIPYFNHFESFNGFYSVILSEFEYGYGFFEWLIKSFSSNYSVLLLVHAIIYYLLIFSSFKRYTSNLYLSLMLFYSLSMGVMGSNRQLIALAICLYAIRFVVEKKPVFFFLLVLLATTFHTTAFLFAIFYFINKSIRPIVFVSVLLGAFIIGNTPLPQIIFLKFGNLFGGNVLYKTTYYTEGAKEVLAEGKLSMIGFVKRLLFLSFFYYSRKQLSEKLAYYNILLNGYYVGFVMYFLFSNSLLIIVNRGSLYFNIMEPLLITSQMYLLKGRDNKFAALIILFIISIIFFFQSIATYTDLFIPYKGVFINTDYFRIMY